MSDKFIEEWHPFTYHSDHVHFTFLGLQAKLYPCHAVRWTEVSTCEVGSDQGKSLCDISCRNLSRNQTLVVFEGSLGRRSVILPSHTLPEPGASMKSDDQSRRTFRVNLEKLCEANHFGGPRLGPRLSELESQSQWDPGYWWPMVTNPTS